MLCQCSAPSGCFLDDVGEGGGPRAAVGDGRSRPGKREEGVPTGPEPAEFPIDRTLLLEEDFEEEPEEDRGVNFTTECVFGLGYTFTWFLQVLGLDLGPIRVFLTLTK